MTYNLELTKNQAKIIKIALEEYFRLRMNQWIDFVDEVAMDGYVYNKDDPENSKKFNDYIERRDESKKLFEKAMHTAQPNGIRYKTEEMMIAEDIWQVIRYQLYLDKPEPKLEWDVAGRKPLQFSQEPLPRISKKII